MLITRVLVLTIALIAATATAHAQISDGIVKIGVMNDQSGTYADISGPGSTTAARLAVEDFGAAKKGLKVEIVVADHLNKPDVGSSTARQWFDAEKVDVIVDVPTSSVALAINQVTRDKGKAFLVSGAATSDLTGKACSPNTIHWTYDTWALANGTGSAIVKTGGDTWFFLTADYAFGHALERDTEAVVVKNGGKVLGKVRHPFPSSDFSSFLLQAQASKAKIIGLANAGADTTNAIKQAAEFGIVKGGQNLAGLLVFLTDVHALGLPTAQGLIFTEAFYWDANDKTRAFAAKFAERDKGIHPTMIHPGAVRPAPHRADQRLVLRPPEPGARDHLRPAQHHQLQPRRPVHDGRLRRLFPPPARRARVLAGAGAVPADRRPGGRRARAHHAQAAVPARPPLRPPAHLRARAHHPGALPQRVR